MRPQHKDRGGKWKQLMQVQLARVTAKTNGIKAAVHSGGSTQSDQVLVPGEIATGGGTPKSRNAGDHKNNSGILSQ